jgi:hypothetical protein
MNNIINEQQSKVHTLLEKVKSMSVAPSTNSAKILLQRAYSAASSGDLSRSEELYNQALDCVENNVSYF